MTDSPGTASTAETEHARLTRAVEALNGQTFFKLQDQFLRALFRQFLMGVAFGLGSFLGATIVVSMLVYSLSQIDFIPILGEWAARIAAQIQRN
jgi:hypothetical protein